MKKIIDKIVIYIIAGIITFVGVPLILLYRVVKTLVLMPKYGIRKAYLKCWNENKFYKEETERDKAINSWPTDPVERAKMPRLKLRYDFQFEFSSYANMSMKELVYVASEKDEVIENMLTNDLERFNKWAEPLEMRVVYLPSLYKRLIADDVVEYRKPSSDSCVLSHKPIGNDYMLQYLIHPEDAEKMKGGFLWTQTEVRSDHYVRTYICYYLPLSSKSDLSIEQQLDNIKKIISDNALWLTPHVNCEVHNIGGNEEEDFADNNFNSQYSWYGQENIEDLMTDIKEKITLLRQRGIAQHILEELIRPDDRLSRLVVTKDFRILLPDYNNMEIKMEPLAKAVYLLFLSHPEGIVFKCLPDYRKELAEIYVKLRPLGLTDRALQSIEDVTNPLLNSINEKCARIRGAFVGQFDDHMARHYYIDGRRGEAKKISLPRDLVVWE